MVCTFLLKQIIRTHCYCLRVNDVRENDYLLQTTRRIYVIKTFSLLLQIPTNKNVLCLYNNYDSILFFECI